jgi:broad specificity phosphatase PhoE
MDQLDPHRPRALAGDVVVSRKQVIFIRHGQSIANAAGTESEEEHASIRWLDAPMTALGRSQANSWAGVAATWGVEEVWCSPLSRAMESACRIFQDCEVPIHVTPHAREGWWHCTENRGRLAHAIAAGTDGSSDERRWPALAELPGAHKLRGLERLAAPTQDVWDPAEEERMMGDEQALFDRWKASIAELKLELSRSPAHRIALVCHWGIIEALTTHEHRRRELHCRPHRQHSIRSDMPLSALPADDDASAPRYARMRARQRRSCLCPRLLHRRLPLRPAPAVLHARRAATSSLVASESSARGFAGVRAYEEMILHCALPLSPHRHVANEESITLATRTRAPDVRVSEGLAGGGIAHD